MVNYLGKLLSLSDDNISLKVLQTMLLFITEEHLDFNSFELIYKVRIIYIYLRGLENNFMNALLYIIYKILRYELFQSRS